MDDNRQSEQNRFAQPQTFRYAGSVKGEIATFGCVLIPLFLIAGFLIWLLLTGLVHMMLSDLPFLSAQLIGGALVLIVMGVLGYFRVRQMSHKVNTMSITVDAHGITQRDPHAIRYLAWSEIVSAEHAADLATVRRSAGSSFRYGSEVRVGQASNLAIFPVCLLGPGVITVDDDAPRLFRLQYAQNELRWGLDPTTGRPRVAISPGVSERGWDEQEIGTWVRHFRPDIWEQAHALMEELRSKTKGAEPPATGAAS